MTLDATLNLANAIYASAKLTSETSDLREALSAFEGVVEGFTRVLGADHEDVLKAKVNLGSCCATIAQAGPGTDADAKKLLERAASLYESYLGKGNEYSAWARAECRRLG